MRRNLSEPVGQSTWLTHRAVEYAIQHPTAVGALHSYAIEARAQEAYKLAALLHMLAEYRGDRVPREG